MDTSDSCSILMREEDRVKVTEGVNVMEVRLRVPEDAVKREYLREDSEVVK